VDVDERFKSESIVTECQKVNNTELQQQLRQYCQGPEWNASRESGSFPENSIYDESDYDNVFIFCEHVETPNFLLMNKIVMLATLLMLVFLMMGLGVTMEPRKILKFAKRPVGATIATLVQFGLMPFVAYGLGLAFQMDQIKMLTMIILGCCPGGTLSNFMALLLRGDMNLSILMTSVSTLVGVGAIPGMIKLLSGFVVDECTDMVVDPVAIIKPLAMTLVPCGIGMLIKKYGNEKICNVFLLLGKIFMLLGMSTIIICQILIYKTSLITRFPVDVLIAISFIPGLGFIFGFLCSWIVREPPRARRTIMLETGLKNAQICLAIMLVTFPAEKVGVLMMMPMYFVMFQCFESAILAFIFTKILSSKDEDEQAKLLSYTGNIEKSKFQREYSQRIAKRTHTPIGRVNSTNESFENLIVSRQNSHTLDITCNNCGNVTGTLTRPSINSASSFKASK